MTKSVSAISTSSAKVCVYIKHQQFATQVVSLSVARDFLKSVLRFCVLLKNSSFGKRSQKMRVRYAYIFDKLTRAILLRKLQLILFISTIYRVQNENREIRASNAA